MNERPVYGELEEELKRTREELDKNVIDLRVTREKLEETKRESEKYSKELERNRGMFDALVYGVSNPSKSNWLERFIYKDVSNFVLDRHGNIVICDGEALDKLGYNIDELMKFNNSFADVLYTEDGRNFREALDSANGDNETYGFAHDVSVIHNGSGVFAPYALDTSIIRGEENNNEIQAVLVGLKRIKPGVKDAKSSIFSIPNMRKNISKSKFDKLIGEVKEKISEARGGVALTLDLKHFVLDHPKRLTKSLADLVKTSDAVSVAQFEKRDDVYSWLVGLELPNFRKQLGLNKIRYKTLDIDHIDISQ